MILTTFKKTYLLCLASALFINACTNGEKHSKQKELNTTKASLDKPQYEVINMWIDDFRNLRTAIYKEDVEKQKAYFNFPLNADTTQVWEAVYDQVDENKRPSTLSATFTEADFEKYRHAIFSKSFMKGLLKVKSKELFQTGEYTTAKINEGKETFSMIAQYDKATTTLQLSLTYPGGTDEEGNYVSEGEYAIIYFFKVEQNKHLKFDKILFAG
jgi:hypothetical protein